MKVIYLFTPQHVGFLNVVSSLQNYILYTSSKAENKVIELIISIPSFAIIIFGTLVFNEMIILNCFDLDIYTKPGFRKRFIRYDFIKIKGKFNRAK